MNGNVLYVIMYCFESFIIAEICGRFVRRHPSCVDGHLLFVELLDFPQRDDQLYIYICVCERVCVCGVCVCVCVGVCECVCVCVVCLCVCCSHIHNQVSYHVCSFLQSVVSLDLNLTLTNNTAMYIPVS